MKYEKPLNRRAYGSIPHLPNSRLGPGDHSVTAGEARICLEKCRPQDTIVVQSKLDGSNVCVAKIDGIIIPLIRAGYRAINSRYEQHRRFDRWVFENLDRFDALLDEGERLCGEWLLQAHGTRYKLKHEPFVAFDLIKPVWKENHKGEGAFVDRRATYENFQKRVSDNFVIPRLLHYGNSPFNIEKALELLEDRSYHGELDPAEGAVWRVENAGKVQFLCKYVRPDKEDGIYLPIKTGGEDIWNEKL